MQYKQVKKDYFISKSSGRDLVNIRPLDWAKKLEDNGAGEIVITAVNKEGLGEGFDIPLIKLISQNNYHLEFSNAVISAHVKATPCQELPDRALL